MQYDVTKGQHAGQDRKGVRGLLGATLPGRNDRLNPESGYPLTRVGTAGTY